MPLLAIKLHEQKIWLLFEYMEDLDPMKFLSLTNALFNASQTTPSLPSISKSEIKSIMTLAQCIVKIANYSQERFRWKANCGLVIQRRNATNMCSPEKRKQRCGVF